MRFDETSVPDVSRRSAMATKPEAILIPKQYVILDWEKKRLLYLTKIQDTPFRCAPAGGFSQR